SVGVSQGLTPVVSPVDSPIVGSVVVTGSLLPVSAAVVEGSPVVVVVVVVVVVPALELALALPLPSLVVVVVPASVVVASPLLVPDSPRVSRKLGLSIGQAVSAAARATAIAGVRL